MLKDNIMNHIEFIKKQAKNFLKDWQTQTKTVEDDGFISYHYDWKFYDVGDLFFYYELDDKDEQDMSLGHAQHFIAQMVGFKKWDDLVNASEPELELAVLLLRRFKNSQNVQDWQDTLQFSGVAQYGPEAILDYAKQYFELGDTQEIAYLPTEQITILSGKPRTSEFNNFDAEHNPAGMLRKDSYVFCPHCQKAYNFTQSKVIKNNANDKTLIVCKNYPDCRGTYLDYKVLSSTVIYGPERMQALERHIQVFPRLHMDDRVFCMHCHDNYYYKDAKVVKSPEDGFAYVQCKNYPECDGTILDMFTVDDVK